MDNFFVNVRLTSLLSGLLPILYLPEAKDRVISVLAGLNPILIYLAPKDIEQLHTQITRKKNEKWREAGREGTWEAWGNTVYERQKWFTNRSLNSKAMARFFNEWAIIADKL